MADTLTYRTCRRRLAFLWLLSGAFLFALLIIQSIGRVYGEQVEAAWAWFLPTVMPTLSLIISIMVAESKKPRNEEATADEFLFHVAFALSAIYLLLIIATFFSQPIAKITPLSLMKRANLWLAPIQGIVAAALGAFFVRGSNS